MTRDAENWDRLQTLFHLGEHTPVEELDAHLLDAEPDAELRGRARTLILAGRRDSSGQAAAPALPQTVSPGHIGPYRVLRHLGTGGMGAVYLVERLMGGAIQHTALKVLSNNSVGPLFLERFAREQHILASLDHPNITRMLDAGLSDASQPYLVMEYVDGLHLDVYCDRHSLDIAARLKLFISVCDAIAYAHRNLVVHLDLKPSNILASAVDGRVKVLDFGTSKLISADGSLTTTLMVTPAYASPEQLRSEAVTTSCDIYALGAILYELLAGQRPNFDRSVLTIIERSIREQAPEPVTDAVTDQAAERRGLTTSGLRGLLSGDLATIVAKCLRPRPQDRYPSVDALAADLELYLAGRPVLARRQTTTYRLGKFVRRNRKGVLAASLAALAFAASIGYAGWRQQQAIRAGQRALQMQEFTYALFRLANSNYLSKPQFTVPEFLELGVRVLPDFIHDARDRRVAELSLAESMFDNEDMAHALPVFDRIRESAQKDGDVEVQAQAEAYAAYIQATFGEKNRGVSLATHALHLAESRVVSPSERVRIKFHYAATRLQVGVQSRDDLRLMQSAVEEALSNHLPDRETASMLIGYAELLGLAGQIDQGELYLKQASEIYDREPYAQCDRAEVDIDLAYVRDARQDIAVSAHLFEQAYTELKACRGEDDHRTLIAQAYLAAELLKLGRAAEVRPAMEAALPKWERIAGGSPEMFFALRPLADARNQTGDYRLGKDAALACVAVLREKIGDRGARIAACYLVLAQAEVGLGDGGAALEHVRRADDDFSHMTMSSPVDRQRAGQAHALRVSLESKPPGQPIPGVMGAR